jgi:hypothetical protein
MKYTVRIIINITEDQHKNAKIKSESLGLGVSSYLRSLLIKDLKLSPNKTK